MAEKTKLKRHWANEAIALAMQGRWEEAVAINKAIIELFPNDIDAYNRLGKALNELGQYTEAQEAYKRVLEIDPNNTIAQRNLGRLCYLQQAKQVHKDKQGLDLSLFIKEVGKTTLVNLYHPASRERLIGMSAGEQVRLKIEGKRLIVETEEGEYLGEVEPKTGLRLIKLMEGGNRYQAAIASLENGGKVIIKETFQHPSQQGRPSFPSRATDSFRPYIKDSLFKYELEEETTEWGEEGIPSFEDTAETKGVEGETYSLDELAESLEEEDEE
jgi:hypothetical protein